MRKKRRIIKRASLKTFGFFLFFAAIIWILVQFSKIYTQDIEIPIQYINVPLDKSISDQKPDHVDLQMQDRGFSIYYYKILKPELTIDLSRAKENGKNLVYKIQDNIGEIEDELKINFEKSRIIQDEVVVEFQYKKEKMLKIIPNIEINYAVGYSADDPVELKPDSVKVSGPEKIVDSITTVPTITLKLNKINEDIVGKIDIDTTGLGMLSFYETQINYTQKVEKFTEGSMQIPVEVINVPDELNLAYFPKSILVYFQVNLKKFESVSAADFRVVCDYATVNEGDDFMIANIVEKPKFIDSYRLSERRVQFVIKR